MSGILASKLIMFPISSKIYMNIKSNSVTFSHISHRTICYIWTCLLR